MSIKVQIQWRVGGVEVHKEIVKVHNKSAKYTSNSKWTYCSLATLNIKIISCHYNDITTIVLLTWCSPRGISIVTWFTRFTVISLGVVYTLADTRFRIARLWVMLVTLAWYTLGERPTTNGLPSISRCTVITKCTLCKHRVQV